MHRTTLYARANEGRLEMLRMGGRTYVRAAELERFVREELELEPAEFWLSGSPPASPPRPAGQRPG
jgi:hypothetical protein